MIILGIIVWIFIGIIIAIMAGLTYNFDKRFFNPVWLIPFGPLSIGIWLLLEKFER